MRCGSPTSCRMQCVPALKGAETSPVCLGRRKDACTKFQLPQNSSNDLKTKECSPGHVPGDLMFGLCSCLWSSSGYFSYDHTRLAAVALPSLPNTRMTSYEQNGGVMATVGSRWVKSFLSVKLQSACIILLL